MKKILVFVLTAFLVFGLSLQVSAVDSVVVVVANGKASSVTDYFATGGDNPFFENLYHSKYGTKGTAGIAVESILAGAIKTTETLEVQEGYGYFVTKVGTGTLIISTEEAADGTATETGILQQNAIGFGGNIKSGIVGAQFETVGGLHGIAEVQATGRFAAGAVEFITEGTEINSQIVEKYSSHWRIDGDIKAKFDFKFPSILGEGK